MAMPRALVVADGEIAAYHCIARCVRRALLCGKDTLTGRDLGHRKTWIHLRLREIARAFAIDIGGYAAMSNHLHVVAKTRPDIAANWDADAITKRWRIAFPINRPPDVLKTLFDTEVADKKLVESRRRRLANISWFMRCLLEPIARRANKEDSCKGRFWEERFHCVGLLDDSAILTCTAYVDLNPIRAGIAKTPEESEFTSIYDRIRQRQDRRRESVAADNWLSPITSSDRIRTSAATSRASHQAWLDLSLDDYLELLDWTGRQMRAGKPGAIPAELAPILERLKVRPEGWWLCATSFTELFRRYAGSPAKLEARVRKQSPKRIADLPICEEIFD